MEKNVIVFGATGNTGIKVCEELSKQKIKHSAFIRKGSEEKIDSTLSEIIIGNVLDIKDVKKTLSENSFTDIVVTLGSRSMKIANIRSKGTKNVIDVLTEINKHAKIHVLSAHGVRDSYDAMKWYEKILAKLFLGKTMKDHDLQESVTITNPGGYHIIRAVALKNDIGTGKIHSQQTGFLPHGDISRADVAKFIVDSLLSDKTGAISICKA